MNNYKSNPVFYAKLRSPLIRDLGNCRNSHPKPVSLFVHPLGYVLHAKRWECQSGKKRVFSQSQDTKARHRKEVIKIFRRAAGFFFGFLVGTDDRSLKVCLFCVYLPTKAGSCPPKKSS